jgi:hypothetical protein
LPAIKPIERLHLRALVWLQLPAIDRLHLRAIERLHRPTVKPIKRLHLRALVWLQLPTIKWLHLRTIERLHRPTVKPIERLCTIVRLRLITLERRLRATPELGPWAALLTRAARRLELVAWNLASVHAPTSVAPSSG